MLSDHGLQRTLLAERRSIFRAQQIQMSLRFGFIQALALDQAAKLADLLADAGDSLRNRFKIERELSALAAKRFDLHTGVADFLLQTHSFAIRARQPLFGLSQLIAQPRSRRHSIENR